MVERAPAPKGREFEACLDQFLLQLLRGANVKFLGQMTSSECHSLSSSPPQPSPSQSEPQTFHIQISGQAHRGHSQVLSQSGQTQVPRLLEMGLQTQLSHDKLCLQSWWTRTWGSALPSSSRAAQSSLLQKDFKCFFYFAM